MNIEERNWNVILHNCYSERQNKKIHAKSCRDDNAYYLRYQKDEFNAITQLWVIDSFVHLKALNPTFKNFWKKSNLFLCLSSFANYIKVRMLQTCFFFQLCKTDFHNLTGKPLGRAGKPIIRPEDIRRTDLYPLSNIVLNHMLKKIE